MYKVLLACAAAILLAGCNTVVYAPPAPSATVVVQQPAYVPLPPPRPVYIPTCYTVWDNTYYGPIARRVCN